MTIQKLITEIRKTAGNREKNILLNLSDFKQVQKDKTYNIFRLTDSKGNYFEYETNTKKIIG